MSARRTLLMQPSRRRETGGIASSGSRGGDSSEPLTQLASDSDLPAHEPLQLPLNEGSVRALSEISSRTTTLKAYDTHLKRSTELLREAMGSINETYSERKAQLQERIENREQRGRTKPNALELELTKAVERLANPVADLSKEIERGARKAIDLQMELEDERKALEWVSVQLVARQGEDRHRQAQREIENSNRRAARAERASKRQRQTGDGEDGDSGDELKAAVRDEAEEQDTTDDEGEGPPPMSAVEALNSERSGRAAKYAALTAHQKYALNNDYATFKQTWHLAMFQENDVALPDASAWFDADGQPAEYGPHVDAGGAGAGDGDNSDEDLVVEREIISLKCPLSLVTMTDPYKSGVCMHVFERTAIMEFLSHGPKTCPQTGCDKVLIKTQMSEDNVMRRRILRAQKMEQRRNEAADTSDIEGDAAEDVENVVVSASQADALGGKRGASQAETAARSIKRERFQRTR